MIELSGKSAVVTGATQGIGMAIAKGLLTSGVDIILLGRSIDRLETAKSVLKGAGSAQVEVAVADLSNYESLCQFATTLSESRQSLDILVNCGGCYASGPWTDARSDTFRDLLDTNVRGPAALSRLLVPLLAEAKGDIVFINSSIVRSTGQLAGMFAASQHGLRAVADSLRAEVNGMGIRVTSIYPGRTATPRQQAIYEKAGNAFPKDKLLQPTDVADALLSCLRLTHTAEVTDLYVRQRYDC